MKQLLKRVLKRVVDKTSHGWFERFGQVSPSSPTWPLDSDRLSRLTVYWPDHYPWGPSTALLDALRLGISHWAKLERRPIVQPYKGVIVFEISLDDRSHRIAVDYSDYMPRIERDALAEVSLYFKMQCLQAGYDMTEPERGKFFPGGYGMADYRLTARLQSIRSASKRMPYQYNVYGRFGLEFSKEIRTAAVERLQSDPSLGYEGGLQKVRYRQTITEASHSKICIDLPGNGDFCYRLIDYLAIGAFVIAYPHRTILPSPLINGKHLVYMKSDLSDLAPLCQHYLNNPNERRAIQNEASAYFDRYGHYAQLGSWYLHTCMAKL